MSYNVQRLITILVIFLTSTLLAQAPDTLWTGTYGGSSTDYGYFVQQTSDGGYIITGSTSSFGAGGNDVWLIKTNSSGDTLWTKTFGGSSYYDYGRSVQQTSDGGYIIVGDSGSYNYSDIWLIKTNTSGDSLWTKTFGGSGRDIGNSVRQTNDGGYIITGEYGDGDGRLWLIKTNASGGEEWNSIIGSNFSSGSCVQQTSDEGFIVTGHSGYDAVAIKTDINGNVEWNKTIGGGDKDFGNYIQQTSDGGYIITGRTKSFGAGYFDVWLIKTNDNGDTLWTQTFGGNEWDEGNCVQQTSDGGYIIVAETVSFGAGESDVWVIRTDAQGNTLWTRTFGGGRYDQGLSVQQTRDGGYILAGSTESFGAGSADVWLICLGPESLIAVESEETQTLHEFALHPACPNPFNPTTTIGFDLPVAAAVTLTVYDILGREMARLENRQMGAGYHQATWNGRASNGREAPTGIYFARIRAAEHSQTIKMLLLK